ncbi:Glutathione S-transferase [Taenia crassiceps]|uniref:glutathione transferase n=1 Tax=Taenia crassiceps TaxID=6207 RepID=A0ABR4Q6M1_9CEST
MGSVVGYWNGKGLGELIRLLLAYLEVDFIDKRYKIGPALTDDSGAWLLDKYSLGLDFPNLPYYIDGDFKLTHLGAIVEFIAEVHGMISGSKKQRAVLHMLQCEVMGFRVPFITTVFDPGCEVFGSAFFEMLTRKLAYFGTYLDEKQWFTGEKKNYPDFALCDLLIQMTKFEPMCLNGYPQLRAYLSRFENLPELKDYPAVDKSKA